MKCLGETSQQVAHRLRSLADGVSDQADAQAIRIYANSIERAAGTQLPPSHLSEPENLTSRFSAGLAMTRRGTQLGIGREVERKLNACLEPKMDDQHEP